MKIYVTRHGETEWNKEHRMQGNKDSKLTVKGVESAKRLGENLKHIDFKNIYCSPLGRAVDTAKYIRGGKNTNIILKEVFKEMNFGKWEGMLDSEIEELYDEQYENFWNKPHLYKPIYGEGYDELIERVKKGLYSLVNDIGEENILIVTHTCVIKAIYSIIKNISIEDFWCPPYLHGTSLTILEVDNGEISIVLEADVSHLG